jgi:hypothetical protein
MYYLKIGGYSISVIPSQEEFYINYDKWKSSDISDFQAIDSIIIVHGYIEYSLFCITLLLQSWCIPPSQSKSAQTQWAKVCRSNLK